MLRVDTNGLIGAARLYESVGFMERKRFILYRWPLKQLKSQYKKQVTSVHTSHDS